MIEQYAQSLAHYLLANPHWGGLLTFLISFLESLAVIGTIVPGSVTMTAVGILVGMGIMTPGMTLLWAILGAFLGDLLGYWVGKHYNKRLRNMWPFKTRPQWLETGEKFFHKHGGKSIIIGRFIGPLRSLIPLIAGLLYMPWQRFILAAIPSAALWAIVYMLPGFLLGALSLQLPPHIATKFILILLLAIVMVSLFAWLIKYLFKKFKNYCSYLLKNTWEYMQTHKQFALFTRIIAGENQKNYQQLAWLIYACISCIIFVTIFLSVTHQNPLTALNLPVFEFLRSVRHIPSDHFFMGITMLGDGKVLISSAVCILFWFIWQKNSKEAFHFFLAIVIGSIAPNLFKSILYFPRPSGLLHSFSTSSFPSGHAFLAFMYYGFLAIILASHVPRKFHRYPYFVAGIFITLIGFSRLYLGAHWLTDVLASFSLAFAFLALLTLSYRRKIKPIKTKQLALLASLTTLLFWAFFFTLSYHKNLINYTLLWPSKTIEESTWWSQKNLALPIYRQNRLGKPAEPMNIQYVGEIRQVEGILTSQGWTANPDLTLLKATLEKIVNPPSNFSTLLPSLYLNNPPILYMVKNFPDKKLILKLWISNVYLDLTWEPLYVGSIVQYQIDTVNNKIVYSFNVTNKVLAYLNKPHWQTTSIKIQHVPKKLVKKQWKGEILQIKAPRFY